MAISRRKFLRIGAGGISVSLLYPALLKADLSARPFAPRMLVVLQLSGGNDALNTFIPYTDRKYRDARPTLAIPDSQILKVSDRFGFHPSMTQLKDLYERGKFAFINDVGFPSLDRSHFRCRDVWQSGDESLGTGVPGTGGWLGRYADTYLADTATAVTSFAVGPRSPLGLDGDRVSGTTIADADVFFTSTDLVIDPSDPSDHAAYRDALFQIYKQPRQSEEIELVRARGNAAFQAVELFKGLAPSSLAPYPASYLGKTFQLVARLAAAEIGTTIAWISVEGFDTHGLQANTHASLLADVSSTLWAFQQDLEGRGLSERVVVLAWTEFGRRVFENGNLGTDHGKAGTVFLVGDRVEGGMYGDVPDLTNLDDGDLRTRIDFRSVYWTLIQDWFGHDPLPVLRGRFENLGFIQRPARSRAVRQ